MSIFVIIFRTSIWDVYMDVVCLFATEYHSTFSDILQLFYCVQPFCDLLIRWKLKKTFSFPVLKQRWERGKMAPQGGMGMSEFLEFVLMKLQSGLVLVLLALIVAAGVIGVVYWRRKRKYKEKMAFPWKRTLLWLLLLSCLPCWFPLFSLTTWSLVFSLFRLHPSL